MPSKSKRKETEEIQNFIPGILKTNTTELIVNGI
jgi:hypothetical protein